MTENQKYNYKSGVFMKPLEDEVYAFEGNKATGNEMFAENIKHWTKGNRKDTADMVLIHLQHIWSLRKEFPTFDKLRRLEKGLNTSELVKSIIKSGINPEVEKYLNAINKEIQKDDFLPE